MKSSELNTEKNLNIINIMIGYKIYLSYLVLKCFIVENPSIKIIIAMHIHDIFHTFFIAFLPLNP